MYPTEMSAIELAFNSNDTVEEFYAAEALEYITAWRQGTPDNPGGIDEGYILDGIRGSTIYDRPWYYDEHRSLDFFVEVEF